MKDRLSSLDILIESRKAELDALRPLPPEAVSALDRLYDIELTYTSNAIEGNTLSASETQLVIEKGVTIGGKSVREHLEVVDHVEALGLIRNLARESRSITERDVIDLHGLVLKRSNSGIAGRYADHARIVMTRTGRHAFPNPAKAPALMAEFADWLQSSPPGPPRAFDAHRRLVAIHPFNDGNGRTARLLMNLLLLRDGYPPVSVRPEERMAYIDALAADQAGEGPEGFDLLMRERLDASLQDYLEVLGQAVRGGGL